MRAGRQNKTSRPEGHRVAADQGGDLIGGKASPHDGFGLDAGTGGHRSIEQRGAKAELSIGHRIGVAVGQRLRVLAARGAAFVQNNDRGASLGCRDCRRQPARTSANHQHVADPVLGLRAVRLATKVRERQGRVAGDSHALGHLGHAGALTDAAIDCHHAVEARPHPAVQTARRAALGAPKCDDASGRQRGGDRLAFQRGNRRTVELERNGTPDRADGGMGQTHCRCSSRCARCGKIADDVLAH